MDTNQKTIVEKNGGEGLNAPVGFRFCPTDYQALRYYLYAKVNNEYYDNNVINEFDMYQYHPNDLPGLNPKEKFGYYFTVLTKKYEYGTKPDRTIKGGKEGFWKINSKVKEFKDRDGTILGRKRTLNYHLNSKVKTEWKMHEFVLDQSKLPSQGQAESSTLVLCKIYLKQKDKEKKEESQGGQSKRVHQTAFPNESSIVVQQPKPNLKHKQPLFQPRPEIGGSNCQSSQMQPDQLRNFQPLIGNPPCQPQPSMTHNTQGRNKPCQMLASNIGQHQPSFNVLYMDSHAFKGNVGCNQVQNMMNQLSTSTLPYDIQAPSTDYSRQNQLHHMLINMQSNVFQAPLASCSRQSQPHQLATTTPSKNFQAPRTGSGGQSQPNQLDACTTSNNLQTPSLGYNSQSQPPMCNDFQAPPTSSSLGQEFIVNSHYIDYPSYLYDPYFLDSILD